MAAPKYSSVKFLRPFAGYNKDEVAKFPIARSEAMIAGKVAVAWIAAGGSKPKKKPTKKEQEPCQDSSQDNVF